MKSKKPPSEDKQFYYKIWSGPEPEFTERAKSIYYVENHNADWDYGLTAEDFKRATSLFLEKQSKAELSSVGVAPACHLVRHTIELQLKALLQFIFWLEHNEGSKLLFSHNIERIWEFSRKWLTTHDYPLLEDARLETVDLFIENLHAIDPDGDLFRFGTSKRQAFGRPKSYDRIGINSDLLIAEFEATYSCLDHWATVIIRELICEEMEKDSDPYFDRNNFPRKQSS